jgi:phosphatidylserine decarboxylase
MKIPLTKYGWPEVIIYPVIVLTIMFVFLLFGIRFLPFWITMLMEAMLTAILVWFLSFFRDPYRICPSDSNLVLAPADGRITDIETVQENDFIGGKVVRFGIFLSIFDPHINRSPCNVKVENITYKPGKFRIACNPQSGRVNESNDLGLVRLESPKDRLIVRQISGAIARRIVCSVQQGQKLVKGEKFGMIKFGSRCELYVLARQDVKCLVKIGDKVKAGLTPLVMYEE